MFRVKRKQIQKESVSKIMQFKNIEKKSLPLDKRPVVKSFAIYWGPKSGGEKVGHGFIVLLLLKAVLRPQVQLVAEGSCVDWDACRRKRQVQGSKICCDINQIINPVTTYFCLMVWCSPSIWCWKKSLIHLKTLLLMEGVGEIPSKSIHHLAPVLLLRFFTIYWRPKSGGEEAYCGLFGLLLRAVIRPQLQLVPEGCCVDWDTCRCISWNCSNSVVTSTSSSSSSIL